MAGHGERIYAASPVRVQQAMVAAYGWWWYHRRFGGEFRRQVKLVWERSSWSPTRLLTYQARRLSDLLRVATQAPYYREVFAKAGVTRSTPPYEALGRLPVLTKETLRSRSRNLLTQDPPPRGTKVFQISRTTGTPTEIYYTSPFHQLVEAFFEVRNRNWAGVTYRDRRAMFGVRKVCRPDQSKPPFWRLSPRENLAYFSIYHLSPQFMLSYVQFLNKFQPKLVMGCPSALAVLARFVLEERLSLAPVKAIITTSETVTDEARQVIEEAWECRVFDQYSAVEACMLATQCEHGRYHVSPDFGYLEIVDWEGNPCPPGEVGTAVCTGLGNYLQPLIRYEVGDAVAWSQETTCPCGRRTPMLQSIEGRIEDLCYTANGKALQRFDTVFKDVMAVREAQIVQEALGHFVLRVVTTRRFNGSSRERLVTNMLEHVGQARIDVVEVDEIQRTPSGKFRAVISKVKWGSDQRAPVADPPEPDL